MRINKQYAKLYLTWAKGRTLKADISPASLSEVLL
jgi:hypothetical protein